MMDSHKPLELKILFAKTILAQSNDKFCCKTIHEHCCSMLGLQKGNLSNAEYYEKFNTRIDVAKTIIVKQVHPVAVDVIMRTSPLRNSWKWMRQQLSYTSAIFSLSTAPVQMPS